MCAFVQRNARHPMNMVVVEAVAERSAIMMVLLNQEILRNRRVLRNRKKKVLHLVRPNAAKDLRVPAKDRIKRVTIKKAKKAKKAKTKPVAAKLAEPDVHQTRKVQVQARAQVQVRAQAAQILSRKRPNPAQAQVPVRARPATNIKKRRSKIKKFGISNRKKENLLARKNDANARKCVNFRFYWSVIQFEHPHCFQTHFFLPEYFFS